MRSPQEDDRIAPYHTCNLLRLPKQPGVQEVLAPHDAVDGSVWGVAQRADGEGLGHGLGLALKALCEALDVHRALPQVTRSTRLDQGALRRHAQTVDVATGV
jgi:hypothetical protein